MPSVLLFSLDISVLTSQQVILKLVVFALDRDDLVSKLLKAFVPFLNGKVVVFTFFS